MGYSIHNFMSQNIFKNKNNKEYPKIIGWTYIFGIAAYTFIALGSFCIIQYI